MQNPKNISELDASNVIGIFFDIDDTFSSDGKISAEAYNSLWNLKNAGKIVVPITGRAAGWCDHIARMWPVDAVVGENGAFYFMMKDGKLIEKYTSDPSRIAEYRKKLSVIREEVLKEVPGAGVASDQDYRKFELAIDHREDVPPLSDGDIDRIIEIYHKHGATTKISSIHVNGWFGDYDKLTTTKIFIENELGLDPDEDNDKFVFAGDSPNDEPMFAFFEKSVGVANVMNFKNRLRNMPKFTTTSRSGAGFAELAAKLITNPKS